MMAQLFTVEPDRGEGIQAMENQAQPLSRPYRIGPIEVQPIPPLALFNPGALLFVTVEEGVGDAFDREERTVDVAGNRYLKPAAIVKAGLLPAGLHTVARLKILKLCELEHAFVHPSYAQVSP